MTEDLSLIPTEDLIIELSSRYDHFVTAGLKSLDHSEEKDLRKYEWSGDRYVVIGLLSFVTRQIHDTMEGETEELNPQDLDY